MEDDAARRKYWGRKPLALSLTPRTLKHLQLRNASRASLGILSLTCPITQQQRPCVYTHSLKTINLLFFAYIELWMSLSSHRCPDCGQQFPNSRGSVHTQSTRRTRRVIQHFSLVTTIKRHLQRCMRRRDARRNGQEPGGETA